MRCVFPLARGNRRFHLQGFVLATAIATRGFRLPTASSLSFFVPPTGTSSAFTETMAGMKNVVAIEREASVTPTTSKDFLLSNPSGAYTTARTCAGGTRIFEWEAHVERTASSFASMAGEEDHADEPAPSLADPVLLRRRLDASVEEAVRLYKEVHGNDSGHELKITALVGWNKKSPATQTKGDKDSDASGIENKNTEGNGHGTEDRVACHVTSLPALPKPPVRVEVRGSPRDNALAKNSAWVSDRAPLEALMAEAETTVGQINELLLTTNNGGEILEGSQTNFYALIDGKLHTAGEGILEGTVRRLVLDVCRAEGIPVVLRPPRLDDLESWGGALLSSTSRLALPIDELYIPTEGCPSGKEDLKRTFDNTADQSLAMRIQALVSAEVEARSTPIGSGEPVPL